MSTATDTIDRASTFEKLDDKAEVSEMDAAEMDAAELEQAALAADNESLAEPPPDIEELKRNHYRDIASLGNRVDQARLAWEGSKSETAEAKKEYEGLNVQLLKLIRRGPELQRELPLGDPNLSDAPLPVDDSWRKLPVTELDVADYIVGHLTNGRIDTLGDLQDYWQAGKKLVELKGIGEASDAAVCDAFSTYGTSHPEVFGEQQATTDEPETDDEESDDEDGVDST